MPNLFRHPEHGLVPRMRDFQPCVYMLASKPRGTIYTGVTSNLIQRLWQHREGMIEGFTSRYKVHRLVYFEQLGTMELAIAREKQLKNWHRPWKVNLLQEKNPYWEDLAIGLGLPPLAGPPRPNLDVETSSA